MHWYRNLPEADTNRDVDVWERLDAERKQLEQRIRAIKKTQRRINANINSDARFSWSAEEIKAAKAAQSS